MELGRLLPAALGPGFARSHGGGHDHSPGTGRTLLRSFPPSSFLSLFFFPSSFFPSSRLSFFPSFLLPVFPSFFCSFSFSLFFTLCLLILSQILTQFVFKRVSDEII